MSEYVENQLYHGQNSRRICKNCYSKKYFENELQLIGNGKEFDVNVTRIKVIINHNGYYKTLKWRYKPPKTFTINFYVDLLYQNHFQKEYRFCKKNELHFEVNLSEYTNERISFNTLKNVMHKYAKRANYQEKKDLLNNETFIKEVYDGIIKVFDRMGLVIERVGL